METNWWKAISRHEEEELGNEISLSNRFIRKMLALAAVTENDVFYDLGCGLGQLLVVAVTERKVKRAVGIEKDEDRSKRAKKYISSLNLSNRIEIRNESFYKSSFGDATIVYTGLKEAKRDLQFYEGRLENGCKLVTLALPLVGVLPNKQDFPFYLMVKPFRKTQSSSEWISEVLSKNATVEEFLAELDYDPDYEVDGDKLERIMRTRFTDL